MRLLEQGVEEVAVGREQQPRLAVAEGDRIRNEAHRQERDFYKFLKKLEDYARILGDSKTVLYLSTQREMFDVLLNPNGGSTSSRAVAGTELPKKEGK